MFSLLEFMERSFIKFKILKITHQEKDIKMLIANNINTRQSIIIIKKFLSEKLKTKTPRQK